MTPDQKYNVDREIRKGLALADEALDLVWDYKIAFELGTTLTDAFDFLRLVRPPYDPSPRPPQEFDPLQTVGKY
jgi:hypothetical protein